MGTAAILLNGVSAYNANDGQYVVYNSTASKWVASFSGTWSRNAYFFEGYSFDNCMGHASAGSGTLVNGLYHHHTAPTCMFNSSSTTHSPLLGYAMDGFPIYGPYGYTTATK
jgi:hypothetical protein